MKTKAKEDALVQHDHAWRHVKKHGYSVGDEYRCDICHLVRIT